MTDADRLLAAMLACPEGKGVDEFGADLGMTEYTQNTTVRKLRDAGLIVCVRDGMRILWTHADHEKTLAAACRDRFDARQAARNAKREEYNRLPQTAEKRRQREARRQRRKVDKKAGARYRWPTSSSYEAPAKPIRSVWDLAA